MAMGANMELYRRDPYVVAAAGLIIAVVLCLVTLLVVMALTREDEDEADTETIEVTQTSPPTLTPGATFTPTVVSATSVPVVGPGQALPTTAPLVVPVNCTAQAGWVTYTVAAGDTLAIIAEAVGSTVDELTIGNCLTDPDSILVGQALLVPQLPTGAAPSSNVAVPAVGAGGGTTADLLVIEPGILSGTTYSLAPGAALTIQWAAPPVAATSVDFYFTSTGTTPAALITTDLDLTDGAVINWTAPTRGSGTLVAVTTLADGSEVSSALTGVTIQ
jgi:LysM repeat protein